MNEPKEPSENGRVSKPNATPLISLNIASPEPSGSISVTGEEDPPLETPAEGTELREAETESKTETESPVVRGSRWVDYDTHELLEMIGELEDERRWARLREGVWLAILIHLAILSAITWIPKYVFKVPQVIDPMEAIKNRKDLQYLDLPPDALRQLQPKVKINPIPEKPTVMDKKTLEALNKAIPPPAPRTRS